MSTRQDFVVSLEGGASVRLTPAEMRELAGHVLAAHGLDEMTQDEYDVAAAFILGHRQGVEDATRGGGPRGGRRLEAVV